MTRQSSARRNLARTPAGATSQASWQEIAAQLLPRAMLIQTATSRQFLGRAIDQPRRHGPHVIMISWADNVDAQSPEVRCPPCGEERGRGLPDRRDLSRTKAHRASDRQHAVVERRTPKTRFGADLARSEWCSAGAPPLAHACVHTTEFAMPMSHAVLWLNHHRTHDRRDGARRSL